MKSLILFIIFFFLLLTEQLPLFSPVSQKNTLPPCFVFSKSNLKEITVETRKLTEHLLNIVNITEHRPLTSDAGATATALSAKPEAICIESQACTDGDLSPDVSGLIVDATTVDEILQRSGIDPLDPMELKQTFTTKHEANNG
jgi:hypothetical protein